MNRLAKEASPYLQQHAKNPVDWFPWGAEALETAKQADKPILLSIGYSACHWCHVMERESFEDEAIAKLMNGWFVCVKVDREERPDLDQIYQTVVQLMGRSGGWPLTVFLTPDQKPFFGGTYFPPADRHGMPGFPRVLQAIWEAYHAKREDIELQAAEMCEAIASVTSAARAGRDAPYAPAPDLLERAATKLSGRFDDANGGFGERPKFPNTMSVDVLLRRGALEGDLRAQKRVRHALDAMRAGGIYDQIGGGFHRYSTDERWLVPHFEKMLYDNALLLRLYADGYRAFGDERYAETAREIAAYVAREMTDASGGFYATQDADSEGEEGKFFVWDPKEMEAALAGDEQALGVAILTFGVTERGNFEEGHAGGSAGTGAEARKSVLFLARPIGDVAVKLGIAPSEAMAALARAKERLFAAREARIKPFRDEKMLASWNGLMIGALADAGTALGAPEMIAAAARAFAFVVERLAVASGDELRVQRHAKGEIVKGPGFLDDHAFVADAALDLYEATGDPSYVARARALAAAMIAHFWDAGEGGGDAGAGGFFFTPDDGERLIHRAKDPFDHAIPSGTSIACKVMLRLAQLRERGSEPSYLSYATRELERLAPAAIENPFGMGQSIAVLDRLVRGSVDVVLVGPRADARTRALAAVALRAYSPNRTIAWLDPGESASRDACAALAEGRDAKDSTGANPEPVAYVCKDRTCSLPIASPSELSRAL